MSKVKVKIGSEYQQGKLVKIQEQYCIVKLDDKRVLFCNINDVVFITSNHKPQIALVAILLIIVWFLVRFTHG